MLHISKLFCLTLILWTTTFPNANAFQGWEQTDPPPFTDKLIGVLPHPLESGKNLIASTHQVLESSGAGLAESWKRISDHRASNLEILKLVQPPKMPESVFVLAKQGLYRLHLQNRTWDLVYRPAVHETLQAFAVSYRSSDWVLGTTLGLRMSKDQGKTWSRIFSIPEGPVSLVHFSKHSLFAAIRGSLYASKNNGRFEKVFSDISFQEAAESPLPQESPEDTTPLAEDEPPASSSPIYDMISSGERLWLSAGDGLYQSFDEGQSWKSIPRNGIAYGDIFSFAYAFKARRLFAATRTGIYELNSEKKRWDEIYRGTSISEIKGLAVTHSGQTLSAVTPYHLITYPILPDQVRAPLLSFDSEKTTLFQRLLRLEPSTAEVRRAVIRYTNTKNSKINRWQMESRMKALMPTFSFSKDFSRNKNIDIDRGSTSDRDLFIEGPQDTSRSWDARVSWDLGDLIYSSDQTSIDSREKLMVELRQDLTAEATHLYYERRRAQLEAVFVPSANDVEHFQKLIQIDELTALLDAMTNGLMTAKLVRVYREYPELERLWEYQPNEQPESSKPSTPSQSHHVTKPPANKLL